MSGLLSSLGTPRMRRWVVLLLMAVLCLSAVPAHAWHVHGGAHVFIAPRFVLPFGPFWTPYAYPPVVVAPAPVYVQPQPPVVVQPSAPTVYWYYCDNPQGYYPYVQRCPGGWRQVVPTP